MRQWWAGHPSNIQGLRLQICFGVPSESYINTSVLPFCEALTLSAEDTRFTRILFLKIFLTSVIHGPH